jgi:hypothetical protein
LRTRTTDPKFSDPRFWGPALARRNKPVTDGWKMKWHNFGNGNVQLRLCVALLDGDAYLCQAYAKTSPTQDQRMAASLKDRIELIRAGRHDERGVLP